MSDAEIRVYERALLRSGLYQRVVAAKILGVDLDRFWLLFYLTPGTKNLDNVGAELEKFGVKRPFSLTKVTVYQDRDTWQALAAIPVVTIQEAAEVIHAFNLKFAPTILLDRKEGREVRQRAYGTHGSDDVKSVEPGWRDPQNSYPVNR